MKYASVIGWGIVIYAVMYLAWSGFVLYGFTAGVLPRICALLILIIIASIAGRALGFGSWKDILPHSLGWAVIVALLDGVYTVPYVGWGLYADWNVWVGYLLVAAVPLLTPFLKSRPSADVG